MSPHEYSALVPKAWEFLNEVLVGGLSAKCSFEQERSSSDTATQTLPYYCGLHFLVHHS